MLINEVSWPWRRPRGGNSSTLARFADTLGSAAADSTQPVMVQPSPDLIAALMQGARALDAVRQMGKARQPTALLFSRQSARLCLGGIREKHFVEAFEDIFCRNASLVAKAELVQLAVEEVFARDAATLCFGLCDFFATMDDAGELLLYFLDQIIEQPGAHRNERLLVYVCRQLPKAEASRQCLQGLCGLVLRRRLTRVANHLLESTGYLICGPTRDRLMRLTGHRAADDRRSAGRRSSTVVSRAPGPQPSAKRPRSVSPAIGAPPMPQPSTQSQEMPFDFGADYVPLSSFSER